MAQTDSEDKSKTPRPSPEESAEEMHETTVELVEALATAFYSSCRKLASMVNRLKRPRH